MIEGNHLYQPPSSSVAVVRVPASFVSGELTVRKLKAGVIVSLLYTLLMLPTLVFSFLSSAKPEMLRYEIVSGVLTTLSSILWIYLTLLLKSFVNLRFELREADRYINIAIGLSLVLLIGMFFLGWVGREHIVAQIAYISVLAFYGVFIALFGWRLRQVAYYRGMKLFAWTSILGGVCTASVVLLLLAIPLSLINGIAMVVLFSAAANELALQSS